MEDSPDLNVKCSPLPVGIKCVSTDEERSHTGKDIHTHSRKSICHLERYSSTGEKKMHSTHMASSNEPGNKKQSGSVGTIQDLEVETTWRKAQEPSLAMPHDQVLPLTVHVRNRLLTGVFFFSIFRKRQPEFSPTSQCPSAHVQL